MKNLFIAIFLIIGFHTSQAQTITFGFLNKTITANSVIFDVTLSSTSSFKLGSGQLYINYNNAAFGNSAVANGRVRISYPTGAVLNQIVGFSVYRDRILNDNTSSRFSFSWQQGLSSGTIPADNITTTPAVLFRVTMDFVDGGNAQLDDICFESGEVFDDQTFTACGPDSPGFPNCGSFPGVQLSNDLFDCSTPALPVELVDFQVWATPIQQVELHWQTETELNNDYFAIERSSDGKGFKEILRLKGAGTYQGFLDYDALDNRPFSGNNYYRLRQVDFDGTFSYSEVRHVFLDMRTDILDINVYPNPTEDFLQVDFTQPLEQEGQMELYNLHGQLVRSYELGAGSFQQELNLTELPKGAYLLRVQLNGAVSSQKVIVQ